MPRKSGNKPHQGKTAANQKDSRKTQGGKRKK